MNAYILHNINDFRYESTNIPTPKENEVLVKVQAVGICGSDIPRIYQTGAYSHPLIPGHEFSGIVTALGTDASPHWLHKRVGIFPLIPCKNCLPCRNNQYEMCRNYSYLGSRQNGGFAEYVAVPEDNLIELPENVSFEEAAMLEPMAVAVHAMKRISPKADETVTIWGLGTIGLLLAIFLQEAGITNLLVIGNKESQRIKVKELGIPDTHYCDAKTQDITKWIMEHTNGNGSDVFFECIGKNETVTQIVNLTAPVGRIMLVGNPYSDMRLDKATYWKILRNQLTIMGTWNSSFTHETTDDWHYVIEQLANKRIAPSRFITHRFDFENLEKGVHIMRDKSEEYIKIVGIMK